jgi:flagellar hook protein FlgE
MIGSLFAGMVGLNVNSTSMTVIGDNISNVNTTAFKSNRSSFANILSSSLAGSVSRRKSDESERSVCAGL